MTDYNNYTMYNVYTITIWFVAYMSCLVFRGGGSDSMQKAARVQVLCTHGTQGPKETSLI